MHTYVHVNNFLLDYLFVKYTYVLLRDYMHLFGRCLVKQHISCSAELHTHANVKVQQGTASVCTYVCIIY